MFDHLLITAPDARRAREFEELLARRIRSGLYPREIAFHVIADPPGRVGSGGATILALRALLEEAGAAPEDFFAHNRVVLLHGGGESRRLPMYAPEGKLFAPIPLSTSALDPPVLLDLHIASLLQYPWTEKTANTVRGEVVVASGDAILMFDPESIPPRKPGVRGIAVRATFDVGSRHGVFQLDPDSGAVVDFHQKKDPAFLARCAPIDADNCAMDSGLFAFDPGAACALISIADATADGQPLADTLAQGDLAIDLYREIVIACVARDSSQDFARRLGGSTKLSEPALDAIHHAMRDHPLTASLPDDALFRHLGTIADYRKACADMSHMRAFYRRARAEIPAISTPAITAVNVAHDAPLPKNPTAIFVENCRASRIRVGPGPNLILGLRNSIPGELPPGICVDQRRTSESETVTLIYAEQDSHKPVGGLDDTLFCAVALSQWLADRQLLPSDIPVGELPIDLHVLQLFVLNPDPARLAGYWSVPPDPPAWGDWFKNSSRMSIQQANDLTDPIARDEQRRSIRKDLLRESILSADGWRDTSGPDLRDAFNAQDRTRLQEQLKATTDPLLLQYRRQTIQQPQSQSQDASMSMSAPPHAQPSRWPTLRWAFDQSEEIIARAPVRLDLAGGWSDTPPYTNRFAGHVVNVAVDLNGQPPIEVRVRRIPEPHIAIRSIDSGAAGRIQSLQHIKDLATPGDPLSLARAALWLSGIRADALQGQSLESTLASAGGVEITTNSSLPTGNGMGTSSILGATILAALHRAMGIDLTQSGLISLVLELERILTTGGGWQDQVGGIVPGVKSSTTLAAPSPHPAIEILPSKLFTAPRHTDRITLYYTGITRLAKAILQDVVSRVNDATPAYLFTIDDIRRHATLARDAINAEDLDALASVLNLTWRSKCLVHPSTTNGEVDALLDATRKDWIGATLLGAGGGGFVLFVSQDHNAAKRLRQTLTSRSAPPGASIYDMALNQRGLAVELTQGDRKS